ncbi:hypothetical protein C1645_838786 [Glomus cerebriforme]|uniref:Uncharacterized protein n=1 Tax=Glomus cerebriforme TaxID=658196 RepID=A0A397S6L9_9GLOM|nr:hypothetical protein C1645_838786 [Glomus cerebriforme]
MASGPVGGGIARSRSVWRFLSVDPEVYPLLGVLGTICGAGGYMLGRKAVIPSAEHNIKLATHQSFPWHNTEENDGEDYKYKYHKDGNPNEIVKSPSADITHIAKVDLPKDASRKIQEKYGEGKSIAQGTYEEGKSKAQGTYDAGISKAQEAYDAGRSKAQEAYNTGSSKVKDTYEEGKSKVKETLG